MAILLGCCPPLNDSGKVEVYRATLLKWKPSCGHLWALLLGGEAPQAILLILISFDWISIGTTSAIAIPKKLLATEAYSFIECFDHDLYNTTISNCQLPQLSNGMLFPRQLKHWEGSSEPLIAPQKVASEKKKLTIPIHNVPAHKFHNSHPLNIRANHFFGEGGRVNSKNSHARNATYLEGINLSISDALSDPSLCSWS